MLDVVGKYKWDAWKKLGDMSPADAKAQYVAAVGVVAGPAAGAGAGAAAAPAGAPPAAAAAAGGFVLTELDPSTRVLTVTLNRPDKRNAITMGMYGAVADAIGGAPGAGARAVLLTGAGPFFSSGNDIGNFVAGMPPGGPAELASTASRVLRRFVGAFLDARVPVVAAVNGPAVGIAATILPLADLVYAAHTATFHTPFTALGLSPEACSSVTFPRAMGAAAANEVLLLGRKLTAEEAEARGLVTRVVEASELRGVARRAAADLAALPPGSVAASRRMIRAGQDVAALHAANDRECAELEARWTSEECAAAVAKFLSKGGKGGGGGGDGV
jgi:peroxisomal 3,2-trans-enoyl-CoA isomerase